MSFVDFWKFSPSFSWTCPLQRQSDSGINNLKARLIMSGKNSDTLVIT